MPLNEENSRAHVLKQSDCLKTQFYLITSAVQIHIKVCSLVFLHQDPFDAMGYFHLALAAALEDKESLSTLYIIYMKLAEIHAYHMPDAELCKRYMDSAQNLRRDLAGYSDSTDTQDHANEYCAESVAQTNAGLSHSSIGPESSMTDTSLMIPPQGESEFMVSNISHKEDMVTRFTEKTDCDTSDHTNPETTCTDNTNHTNGSTLTEALTFVI